jgi:CHAT domain-containing protein
MSINKRFSFSLALATLFFALSAPISQRFGTESASAESDSAKRTLPLTASSNSPILRLSPGESRSDQFTRINRPEDSSLIDAQRGFSEGELLLKEWKAESSRRAIEKFKASLSSWKLAGDRRSEALTLARIGDVYELFGEFRNAIIFYDAARVIDRKTGDRRSEGEVMNKISYVLISVGDNKKALEYCTDALRLSQSPVDKRNEAQALNNIGEIHNWSGEVQKALEFYRRALVMFTDLGDRSGMAQSETYLGFTFSDLGQIQMALDSYERALSLWRSVDDRRGEGTTLTAIGRLYSRMGESQKALSYFEKALQLMQPIGDPIGEARILNGMAYIYDRLGDKQRALEFYNKALTLHQAIQYPNGLKNTLYDIASVYYSLADYGNALNYYNQVLSISTATADRRLQVYALRGIGMVYDASGNKAKAFENYTLALRFYQSQKDLRGEADVLNLIGRLYEARGQRSKGLDSYERALAIAQQANYRVAEAATLYNLARIERDDGALGKARSHIHAALDVIESLRTKVVSQELRTSYFASVHQHYELYVDILMGLHKNSPNEGLEARAFEMSEKARARSLLESLNEARADLRQGVEPLLLQRERNLEQAINARAERRTQLVAAKDNAAAEEVARDLDQLTTEYDAVKAQIKSTSPRYAALTQPQPLSLDQIQQRLLDQDSLLLEYSLGDERSYLWAVTRTEVSSYELPPRSQIEDAAKRFRELLTTANKPVAGESFEQRQARVKDSEADISAAATAFSQMVLGPVLGKLGTKRLLIVPDGVLQYIPFQALMVPATNAVSLGQGADPIKSGDSVPLIVDHEIVNQPSASALALVLTDTAQRKPAANSIAVFANPVFGLDDGRIKSPGMAQAELLKTQETAVRDIGFGEGPIPALPASQEEAEAIIAFAPRGTGLKALGFDANRAAIMKPELAQYRIVHFATHGFIDYKHPELSGLVLSLFDQNGRPQEGFVRLHDIYNLRLSADLVVLSACNTGLGKDVKGEGLIGLTRGFMYAGAGGVAASLWKVDDDATAELMKHFYEGMFQRGLTPAAALREAQLGMWKQKRWHAPYYWAAFVLQGQYDQKEINHFQKSPAKLLLILAGTGTALILFALILLRQRRRRIL